VSSQTFTTVDINGGTIDGTTVGATTPAAGAFTTVKATTGAANGLILVSNVNGDLSYGDPATYANAGLNSLVTPRGMAQGINMTAAASGSNGIQVADSVHLDHGTGAFSLSCKRNLASYVVAAILMEKHDDTTGYRLSTVVTTGYLKLEINDTVYTSNAAPVITGGTEHEFTATASPGATNTTVTFYCDGIIVGTAQTATNETTTDNAVSFYAMGTDAIRTAGIDKGDLVYNRALTAAEVLALYRNGVDFADKWGSQTELIFAASGNANNNTFTSDTGWWNKEAGWTIADGVAHFNGISNRALYKPATVNTVYFVNYRVVYTVKNYSSGGVRVRLGATTYGITRTANGIYSEDLYFGATGNNTIYFLSVGTSILDIDDILVYRIGATLALEGEGMQPAPGQCLDSTTNKLHGMQPATGSSLTRKKDTFEVRWTNIWAGTNEAQYVGGINQAVLPTKFVIERIIITLAGADVQDFILGDGATTDKFIALTSGIAAGTYEFLKNDATYPLAASIGDGTNFKLVIDPDTNCTMTATITVKGFIRE